MSIVQLCPYDVNGENCKYETHYGEPNFSKCKNCDRTNNICKTSKTILKGDKRKAYKENAELKGKLENLQKYLDTQNCYLECAETWMKLTEDSKEQMKNNISLALKNPTLRQGFEYICKENKELSEQLRLAKEMPYSAVKKFAEEKTQDQLIKAKEIIRKLVLEVKGYEEIYGYDACEAAQEAEQFLNSEVEK